MNDTMVFTNNNDNDPNDESITAELPDLSDNINNNNIDIIPNKNEFKILQSVNPNPTPKAIPKNIPFSDNIIDAKKRIQNAKKIAFTYGQNCCEGAKVRFCKKAMELAQFDECHQFNQSSLDTQFVDKNRDIFALWRGAGFWIWKPYLIHKLLTDDTFLKNGDFLLYMDAGAYIHSPLDDMYEFMEMNSDYNGVLFFGVGLPQKQWCKRDAYILQNCDESKCWDKGQINAFMSIWRKSEFTIKLSEMWMNEATNMTIISDKVSEIGTEFLEFREHRHDQAVITNIMNREGFLYGPSGWQLDNYIMHDRMTF